MDAKRYNALMRGDEERLTTDELRAGWHWCREWDYLLVGPGMPELVACSCFDDFVPDADHPAAFEDVRLILVEKMRLADEQEREWLSSLDPDEPPF